MRRGLARLRATVKKSTDNKNNGATVLAEITHQAPARLHPISTADTAKKGSAWCMLGEYGGGLLGGDQTNLDVRVDAGATLTLSTQGATKVLKF